MIRQRNFSTISVNKSEFTITLFSVLQATVAEYKRNESNMCNLNNRMLDNTRQNGHIKNSEHVHV